MICRIKALGATNVSKTAFHRSSKCALKFMCMYEN